MMAPTPERLLDLVDGFAGQEVVLWADLVADRFITGTPKRISREAPVLILSHDREETIPGGGANAVANVAALGGRPLPIGVVGDDDNGAALLDILRQRGISTDGILRHAGYRTPTKTRILGGARHAIKQQIVRYDIEDELVLNGSERDELLNSLSALAPKAGAAILSDYGYGTVDPVLLPRIRERLPEGCPILGDSRYRLNEFQGLDGATPNTEEAEKLLGVDLDNEVDAAGETLRKQLAARFLLITRGSSGMALFTADGVGHVPVHGTDQVADVTGAGDTVIGTFALALAAGATPLEAACLANYAGGVVVMKMGTATLTREELRAAIQQDPELLQAVRC